MVVLFMFAGALVTVDSRRGEGTCTTSRVTDRDRDELEPEPEPEPEVEPVLAATSRTGIVSSMRIGNGVSVTPAVADARVGRGANAGSGGGCCCAFDCCA
jgi:hypothetical protein